ncbi:hypothetical protein [Nonomuraea dietziae]|uniref:hypothetical protein n=1 Tax=Nonomuraea dietziae TaxID=65515 RepID=UPI0031E2ED57
MTTVENNHQETSSQLIILGMIVVPGGVKRHREEKEKVMNGSPSLTCEIERMMGMYYSESDQEGV